ncbi:MAG: 50S ribosomal protein L10 [Clostridiales bacterium]|nr:50S ribosomal protein L10 [Clostridiales bacterium]
MSKNNIEQRKAYVADVTQDINNSASIVLVDYRGITVAQDTAMRKALREAGVKYRVVKNSALSRAFEATGNTGYDDQFVGPTAAAFGPADDPVAPCRVLSEYADKTSLNIKCGVVEGKKFDAAGVKALASIPEKPVLLAQLLGLLQSPMRSLAVAISEIAKKKSA